MVDRTCSEIDCDKPRVARGLCVYHYDRAYRTGQLPEAVDRRTKHVLSNLDSEAGTADCVVCGPGVRVRIRQRAGGAVYVACRKGDQGQRKPRPRKPRVRRPTARQRAGIGYEWHGWKKYGLTQEEYAIRLQAQGGRCLICQGEMERPMIDHDHVTGEVRGILCGFCNSGLGFFRDNVAALNRAAKYVRSYLA